MVYLTFRTPSSGLGSPLLQYSKSVAVLSDHSHSLAEFTRYKPMSNPSDLPFNCVVIKSKEYQKVTI